MFPKPSKRNVTNKLSKINMTLEGTERTIEEVVEGNTRSEPEKTKDENLQLAVSEYSDEMLASPTRDANKDYFLMNESLKAIHNGRYNNRKPVSKKPTDLRTLVAPSPDAD